MRPDPANIGEVRGVTAETDIRDGPGRVGPVFHAPRSHAVVEVPAAIGCGRVDKDDGVAPIEFLKHRLVGGVASQVSPKLVWDLLHGRLRCRFRRGD